MNTQEPFENQQEIDKLRLKNEELKKELEREKLHHKMLFNDWKKLSEQTSAKEDEVYDSKPANPFYKYAFYTLLISLIPAYYFLYSDKGNEKISSPLQPASVSILTSDSIHTGASASVKDSVSKSEAVLTVHEKPRVNPGTVQQPALEQPVVKFQEKKAIRPDTSKRPMAIVNKPALETPLTNDTRDSIYWVGWNAYFAKSRNTFKKSSERYKLWIEGWNDGKAEAKKVLAKDSSRTQK